MHFSAILFDCDGVLVDSEIIYIDVEREHLSRIGLEYSLQDYQERFIGLTSTDFYKTVEDDYAALGKGALPSSFADGLDRATRERMDRDLVAVDGIKPLLDGYRGPKAVASSTRLGRLNEKLRQTGLHHYFDPHIYSGEQVRNGKPAPDLFLFAASKLQASADECLVIEDSINGVRAGRSAGMTVWGFTGASHGDDALKVRLLEAGAAEVFAGHTDLAKRLQP
ncbi:HAD family hydrolase [uncultured Roseibium sp.]|uniref:HAD family hydrolase n=1 Tax=uncultured Roseibium sp. TaxID=1936171 RepID=UPI003216F599